MGEKSSNPPAAPWLLVLPLFDGIVSSAMFAPISFAPLAFLTGTLTLFAVRRFSLPLAAAATGLYGVSYSLCVAPWVYDALYEHYHVGAAASAAFTLFVVGCGVGCFLGTPIWLWRWLNGRVGEDRLPRRWRVLSAAALFFLFEWLRTHGAMSMPWGLIGAGVAGSELLSQSARHDALCTLGRLAALTRQLGDRDRDCCVPPPPRLSRSGR